MYVWSVGRDGGGSTFFSFFSSVVYDFVLLQFRDIRLIAFFCLFRLFFSGADLLAPILVVLVMSCNATFQFLYSIQFQICGTILALPIKSIMIEY